MFGPVFSEGKTESQRGKSALGPFRRAPGSEVPVLRMPITVPGSRQGCVPTGHATPHVSWKPRAWSPTLSRNACGFLAGSTISGAGRSCPSRGQHVTGQLWLFRSPSSHCAETAPRGYGPKSASGNPVSLLPLTLLTSDDR